MKTEISNVFYLNSVAKIKAPSIDRRKVAERIKFKRNERPIILINGVECKVDNISETGLRFIAIPSLSPEEDSLVKGEIGFGDDEINYPFIANVVRKVGDLVSIQLFNPIPPDLLAKGVRRVHLYFEAAG